MLTAVYWESPKNFNWLYFRTILADYWQWISKNLTDFWESPKKLTDYWESAKTFSDYWERGIPIRALTEEQAFWCLVALVKQECFAQTFFEPIPAK